MLWRKAGCLLFILLRVLGIPNAIETHIARFGIYRFLLFENIETTVVNGNHKFRNIGALFGYPIQNENGHRPR